MNEYFAASRMGIGKWGRSQWYDEYTAALSLGMLTDEEVAILRETVEGRNPNEFREVYIVSCDCIRARMLSVTFFEELRRHLEEIELDRISPIGPSDFPPYFIPIKRAYCAACMIQNPQRLPDFDSLFSFNYSTGDISRQQADYLVEGAGQQLERFFEPPNAEWGKPHVNDPGNREDEPDNYNSPILHSAANGRGNRPTSLAEIRAEEKDIEWGDEPANVRIDDESIAKLGKEFGKQMERFHSPKNETTVQKWDRLSREHFNNTGWADLAKMEFGNEGTKPSKDEVRDKSDEIRKAVERFRKSKK